MGITALILVLLFALTPLLIRLLRPWIMRKLQERAVRYVYRQAGMEPPGTERGKRQRPGRREESGREAESGQSRQRSRRRGWSGAHEPIIPPEYPVDVEFTETKDYSEETEITGTDNRSRFARRFSRSSSTTVKVEEQVSDAEWEDIK